MADNENGQPASSRRMEILQQSLAKKQAAFDKRLQNHFDDVLSANGQPLNDKRNGQATLNRWERQNDGLRTADKEIEKTQRAIEREQAAIDRVNNADIPEFLKPRSSPARLLSGVSSRTAFLSAAWRKRASYGIRTSSSSAMPTCKA